MTNTSIPPVGSLWRHRNGQRYNVTAITNLESRDLDRYPITVVYRNVNNETVWSRPVNDWHRSMTRTYLTLS